MTETKLSRVGSNAFAMLLGEARDPAGGLRQDIGQRSFNVPFLVSFSSKHLHLTFFCTTRLVHYILSLLANLPSFGLDVHHLHYGLKQSCSDHSLFHFNIQFIYARFTISERNRDFLTDSIK